MTSNDTSNKYTYKKSPTFGYQNEIDYTNKKHKPYGTVKKDILFFTYLITIIIWGFLIGYLMPTVDIWGWIILVIPIVIFFISMLSLDSLNIHVEENMFRFNVLSTGLIIILPLLALITKDFKGDHHLMNTVILLAIVLILLAMIDVWVPEKWISIVNHIRSIFQTGSLTLILFALYLYYSTMDHLPWTVKSPTDYLLNR